MTGRCRSAIVGVVAAAATAFAAAPAMAATLVDSSTVLPVTPDTTVTASTPSGHPLDLNGFITISCDATLVLTVFSPNPPVQMGVNSSTTFSNCGPPISWGSGNWELAEGPFGNEGGGVWSLQMTDIQYDLDTGLFGVQRFSGNLVDSSSSASSDFDWVNPGSPHHSSLCSAADSEIVLDDAGTLSNALLGTVTVAGTLCVPGYKLS